ncbi:MAG: CRISPR-associated CARF protein Csx1 [candidate division WOR-3 bacterium]
MKLIYQIGRLDAQMKTLKFLYEGKEYEKELSSFALKEHFRSDVKVILIYPVSLPFNRALVNDKSQLGNDLKNKIRIILEDEDRRNGYLENPRGFFQCHPHSKPEDDFILIHSMGEYEGVKFESSYDDIVLEILFDMIDRYIKDRFSELYIDISSGLNIYVSALLEAMRHFAIFDGLQNWSDSSRCKIYKVFSDPILGSSANIFQIHQVKTEFKTFFSSPIKKEDINNYKLSKGITEFLFKEDRRDFKNKLQNYFENFAIHFSAIKNATPLANFTFEFDDNSSIESFIKGIIEKAKERINENWKKSPNLSKEYFLKTLLSLSFYGGIVKTFKDKNLKIAGACGASLEEIKKFEEIYKIFGLKLNETILGKELYNLREGKDREGKTLIEKANDEWKLLKDYLPTESETESFETRNLFAHAGFEKTITMVRKYNEKLYFTYKFSACSKVKEALLDKV